MQYCTTDEADFIGIAAALATQGAYYFQKKVARLETASASGLPVMLISSNGTSIFYSEPISISIQINGNTSGMTGSRQLFSPLCNIRQQPFAS